jgi:hypothetical protein
MRKDSQPVQMPLEVEPPEIGSSHQRAGGRISRDLGIPFHIKEDPMRRKTPPPKTQPSGRKPRGLIIVAQDQPDLWHSLTRSFELEGEVEVFMDRRQGERRERIQPREAERRTADRRRPPSIMNDLRRRSCVLVPLQSDTLHA